MRGIRFYIFIFILLLSILSGVVIYLYNTISYSSVDLIMVIPNREAEAILRFKSLSNLESKLFDTSTSQSEIFNNLLLKQGLDLISSLRKCLKEINDSSNIQGFNERPFFISKYQGEDHNGTILSVFKIKNRMEKSELLDAFIRGGGLSELGNHSGCMVYKLMIANIQQTLFLVFNDGVLALSNDRNLIESCIDQQFHYSSIPMEASFEKIVTINRNVDSDKLFLNIQKVKKYGHNSIYTSFPKYLSQNQSSRVWADYDIDFKDSYLNLRGIILNNEDNALTPLFLAGIGSFSLQNILPSTTYSFHDYSFNAKNFQSLFVSYLSKKPPPDSCLSLFPKDSVTRIYEIMQPLEMSIVGEFGIGFFGKDSAEIENPILFVKTGNGAQLLEIITSLQERIGGKLEIEDTHVVDSDTKQIIYKGIPSPIMSHLFGDFFSSLPSKYMTFIDGYWIVADSKDKLVSVFRDYLLKNTLSNSIDFKRFRSNFSDDENIFVYSVSNSRSIFGTDSLIIDRPLIFGHQMAISGGITYSSFVFDYNVRNAKETISTWKSHLDGSISINPVVLINPESKERLVLVQDSNSVIYLLNSIGRILWKRPIDGMIQGDIIQLNVKGKLESNIIFNTVDKIFQLDFNGNNVGNFPVLLPSKASCGLALFDYDNNGDFRLFVPSIDKQIRVFDKKGNLVMGFKSPEFIGSVDHPIQHFTFEGKDYIVFSDGFSAYILDRKGNERVAINRPFDQCLTSSFYHIREGKTNFIVTSSSKGELIKITIPSGDVVIINGKGISGNHKFCPIVLKKENVGYLFVNNEMVQLLSSDGVQIYSKILELDSLYDFKVACNSKQEYYLGFLDKGKSQFHILDGLTGEKIDGYPKCGVYGYVLDFDENGVLNSFVGSNDNALIHY